jgi:hypothetical protein
MAPESRSEDEAVRRLARMFLEHPAWVAAARRIESDATSSVFFSHRPGEAWRLERRDGRTLLLPGAAAEPDFVFRFTPASIERLCATDGGIGQFALALFELIAEPSPRQGVGFRVAAPFSRLVRRGYLRLLAVGGLRVLAFGAARGVRTPSDLRRLVERVRRREPEAWELEGRDARAGGEGDPSVR